VHVKQTNQEKSLNFIGDNLLQKPLQLKMCKLICLESKQTLQMNLNMLGN